MNFFGLSCQEGELTQNEAGYEFFIAESLHDAYIYLFC